MRFFTSGCSEPLAIFGRAFTNWFSALYRSLNSSTSTSRKLMDFSSGWPQETAAFCAGMDESQRRLASSKAPTGNHIHETACCDRLLGFRPRDSGRTKEISGEDEGYRTACVPWVMA